MKRSLICNHNAFGPFNCYDLNGDECKYEKYNFTTGIGVASVCLFFHLSKYADCN